MVALGRGLGVVVDEDAVGMVKCCRYQTIQVLIQSLHTTYLSSSRHVSLDIR